MADENELDDVEIKLPAEDATDAADSDDAEQLDTPQKGKEDDREAALADLKGQIEAHKAAVAQERAAREEAERRARESAARAEKYDAEAQDGRLTAISNAIRAVNVENDQAESLLAKALEDGDHRAVAKIQRHLAQNEAKLLQLENGKAALEERSKAPVRNEPEIRRPADDPVEAWAKTLSPTSANWVRSHREVVSDPVKMKKIGAAHNYAVEFEGLEPDTPEYFSYIESKLGIGTQEAPKQTAPARRPVPAAPVSSSSPDSPRRGSDGTITLSSAERDMAHHLYPDLAKSKAEAKYASDKVAMMRAGRM